MVPSLLDTFRALASFEPKRTALESAPWDKYVDWAIENGLGPLAAYNLEYRLGGAGAPEWAKDRLLSVYQGSLNDNVMKLVNFKRAIGELEGRRVVLLGAASFSEALYPHVAFRPVLEIEALVPPGDLDAVAAHLAESDFKRVDPEPGEGADGVLFDGRTRVVFYSQLGGGEDGLERVLPMKVYGPSVYRLDLEDALLIEVLGHAQSDYGVPAIAWVDFRELLLGAPAMGGPYSRPVDTAEVLTRAKAWKLERSLWASVAVSEGLFPGVTGPKPALPLPTRKALEEALVGPLSQLDKPEFPNAGKLRTLLLGQ